MEPPSVQVRSPKITVEHGLENNNERNLVDSLNTEREFGSHEAHIMMGQNKSVAFASEVAAKTYSDLAFTESYPTVSNKFQVLVGTEDVDGLEVRSAGTYEDKGGMVTPRSQVAK